MTDIPSTTGPVAIVGAGAIGTALAHAFEAAGVHVAAVASRHPDRAMALAGSLPRAQALSVAEAAAAAPVVLLAVSDSAIEMACEALRPGRGTVVAHTSGSRPAGALEAARVSGALVGGFHPLAAVVRATRLSDATPGAYAAIFRGAAFAVEGDREVQDRLAPLAVSLGGHPFAIVAADKPLYHLGASMLAAFSAGLAQISWDELRAAGVTPGVASAGVAHLLRTVANNIERASSPAAALTGPVARGDAGGVLRQATTAQALSPEVQALYRVHVLHNIALARAAGRIDDATAEMLAKVLE